MNVLIIGTTDILGGAAKISWDVKAALESTGHTVSMFVADKRSDDAHVHTITRPIWRKYLSLLCATEQVLSTDWILDTPEFKNADVVHCHNLHGRFFNLMTLEKMTRQKAVVWTLHDEWALTPHCAYTLEGTELKNGLYVCPSLDTQPRILWDNTQRLTKARVDLYTNTQLHIVTPSQWLAARVEQTALSNQPLTVIPNGINTSVFTQSEKSAARVKLGLPADKKIILFLATAGKANTWKGWKYVAETIKDYQNRNDVLFLNVGNLNPEQNETNIEYREHVADGHELALYYSAADVLLFTSIAENFPLVILEAMSCGLPIVSFDVGGVKEVVSHEENGYVVPYKDTTALKNALATALSLTRDQQQLISQNSALKIKTYYDTADMTRTYLELYQSLVPMYDKG